MTAIRLTGPTRSLLPASVEKTPTGRYPDSQRRFIRALASLSDAEQDLLYRRSYLELAVKQLAKL